MLHSPKALRVLSIFAISVILFSALALSFASPARAAEIVTGDPDALVPADQVIDDDLVITGQNVRIEGTVYGDVFAAGSQVEVTGTIDGNLFVGSQLFINNGTVNGSVYSFSYVTNTGPAAFVADNLIGFAFSVATEEGSFVGRSVYALAYQAIISGQVARDVTFNGAAFRLNGNVGRNLTVQVAEPNPDAPAGYGPWMWVPGNVEFIQPGYEVAEGIVGGETDIQVIPYTPDSVPSVEPTTLWGFAVASWIFNRVGEFISLFLVGALLFLLWPAQMRRMEEQMTRHPWRSLGLGFLTAFLFPFVFVLAALIIIMLGILFGVISLGQLAGPVLVIGFLLLGLATVVFFIAGLLAAKAIFGHLVGSRLLQSSVEDNRWGMLLALLVGLLLYEVVALVPILGWLVALVVILLGWGAMAGALWIKEAKPQARKARKAR
ncbi:MAG: hypothetical protein M1347_01815 [Chloroflexi bacterium]|nr:hypothetical protein [Chloroflexota bacterium]